MYPEFSPDGRWLAYASNESGQNEVFAQSYPDRHQKIKISSEGGSAPCWKRDGRQLYFVSAKGGLMVTVVMASSTFGTPRVLSNVFGYNLSGIPIRSYDLYPDGLRVLAPGDLYGGKPILQSEIPEAFLKETSNPYLFANFGFWLKSDPQRKLSPLLEDWLRQMDTVRINIVQNWFEELKRLVPSGNR